MSNINVANETNEKNEYESIIKEQMDKVDSLFEIKILTPVNTSFARTGGGFVSLTFEEKEYPRISVFRAFPFTQPYRFISVRDPANKNEEIGLIMDLNEWPHDTSEMLLEQIGIRYFTPKVLNIKSIKEEFGFAYWEVLTDRGEMKFTTSIWNPIIRIGGNRLLINDLDSNRYEIDDYTKLTRKETKMIDLFL